MHLRPVGATNLVLGQLRLSSDEIKIFLEKRKKEERKAKKEGNVVENSYFVNYCQCRIR